MASGKRQPSKKKRSSQNRQQRAALQARKQAAQAPQVDAAPEAKRSRWRSAPAAPAAPSSPAPVTAPVTTSTSAAPSAPAAPIDDVPSAPRSSVPERSTEPKTSLLGRLREPTSVNLPAAATGARPAARPAAPEPSQGASSTRSTPAATSRTTARPATVRQAARAGSDRATRRASAQRQGLQPPGYRAALAGVLAALAAVLLCVLETTPVDHAGKPYAVDTIVAEWAGPALTSADHVASATPATATSTPTAKAVTDGVKVWSPLRSRHRLIQALWPLSAGVVLPPIGAILTFQAVRRRRGAKVVTRASYATLFGVLLSTGLAIYFLPAIIGVIVASYQVRRAEMAAIAAAGDGGDVIDTEVVDG